MFSPCPGFPVPMLGTWRPNAHTESQMNWLGWHGADFVPPGEIPADVPPTPDHDNEVAGPPERMFAAAKPAPEPH